jgi:hypothetical protein
MLSGKKKPVNQYKIQRLNMAEVKRLAPNSTLAPYYLGTVTNKRSTTKGAGKNTHAHYLSINPLVAKRLGMTGGNLIKSGDEFLVGAVFNKKKKLGGGKGTTIAKRSIKQGSIPIRLFTGDYILNAKTKKLERESYQVGFPSTLSIIEILYFVHKRMKKVTLVKSGKNHYSPKEIKIPKDLGLAADAAKATA